ncbi:pyruvate formate lyase family protein [bacterium]|nr:pyruvate formate lyase family protein [bacterium]
MERLEVLRKYLRDSAPSVWGEPFHETWMAGVNLDERVRLAQAQAAEMSAAKPFIKPDELIIGNNALRSAVSGLHTPFSSGIRFNREYLQEIRQEHPEAESKLTEIDSYWTKWMTENGQYAPMTCHASPAYERLLKMGVDGMREYVNRWRVTNTAMKPDCAGWYDALLITLDGISGYINAHTVAAEEATVKAQTAQRREELERIASACRHIAHGPPRSFHEAVQLFYLIFSLCGHDSPGPIDRILYPPLKRDLDSGVLSIEAAQEILDCLYLKFEEKTAYGATIGGQKIDGSDATNELSSMCVCSIKRLRLLSPRTALRWHAGLSPELFALVCESVAEGATFPAFVNDEAIIPAMVERGVSLEDAREYTFVGCGQTYPHGRGHGNYEDVVINSAKPLELALNDGIDPVTNQRLGPATGEPKTLLSYKQFEQAYQQQMDNHISERIGAVNDRRSRIKGHAYDFLRSLLTYSCVERGLDWHAGGADYSEGMVDMVGLTTVTDSLVAVKRGVYEE